MNDWESITISTSTETTDASGTKTISLIQTHQEPSLVFLMFVLDIILVLGSAYLVKKLFLD